MYLFGGVAVVFTVVGSTHIGGVVFQLLPRMGATPPPPTTTTSNLTVVMLLSGHAGSSFVVWATKSQQFVHDQPIPITVFNTAVMQITLMVKCRSGQQLLGDGSIQRV